MYVDVERYTQCPLFDRTNGSLHSNLTVTPTTELCHTQQQQRKQQQQHLYIYIATF